MDSTGFNESLFLWVIKHYPKAQVNHAVALLLKNHIIKRPKSYEKKHVDIQISIKVEDIILVGSNQTCEDLLYRMGVSNDILSDPLFVGDYNFMRHSRWFDHHLSFTGGYIQAVLSSNDNHTISWCPSKLFELYRDSLKSSIQSASNSLVFQLPDFERNCSNVNENQRNLTLDVDLDMKIEDSISYRLEDYIQTGRFSGRSVMEIKENIGDRKSVLSALRHLLDARVVSFKND
ncbi:unnamed protein product [Trichobilharzia regenti]|nr:unnamed protein product [Trichobilharzia regenti]